MPLTLSCSQGSEMRFEGDDENHQGSVCGHVLLVLWNKRIKQSFYTEKEKEWNVGLNSKDDF